jgi:hypothetical protein
MAEPDAWLTRGIEAIGEILVGMDRMGAIGGEIPLFTCVEATATCRASRIAALYQAMPKPRGRIDMESLRLDNQDDPPQYRVTFKPFK